MDRVVPQRLPGSAVSTGLARLGGFVNVAMGRIGGSTMGRLLRCRKNHDNENAKKYPTGHGVAGDDRTLNPEVRLDYW